MANEAVVSAEDSIVESILGPEALGKAPEPEVKAEEQETTEETSEATEETTEEPAEEFVDITYEGKLYAVPPELKDAFERASDYTQKTQKLSAERKEFEVQRTQIETAHKQQEFMRSISDEATQIQTLEYQIKEANKYLGENLQKLTDRQILELRHNIDQAREQHKELTGKVQSKYSEFQQAQEQTRKELLDKSTEILNSKVSNWSKVQGDVIQYARDLGFTESQVNIALTDPKQMLIVHDAMQYRRLQEGKTTALKKLDTVPTIKAKARSPMPDDVRKKLDVKNKLKSKSLSAADKAKLIGQDMADRWG